MGIFGKKERVTIGNADPKDNPNTAVPVEPQAEAPTAQVAPDQTPQETPEQKREKSAYKMMITMYPDNFEVKIEGMQNLTNRAVADIMMERAYNSYKNDAIAQASAIKLIDLLGRMQDSKRIMVPGMK